MSDKRFTVHSGAKETTGTYKAGMFCDNCNTPFQIELKRGSLVYDAQWQCPNCGVTRKQIEELCERMRLEMVTTPGGYQRGPIG